MQWKNLKQKDTNQMNVVVYGYGLMGKKVANAINAHETLKLVGIISQMFDE